MTDVHKLALQLSGVAQQYEKYWTEVQTIAKKYEGLPVQVRAIIGDELITDEMIMMLHDPTLAVEVYVAGLRRCRSVLLDVSQELIRGESNESW